MRILYLNHNVAWSSGTFFRALSCATNLAARGHDVTLLSISARRRGGATYVEHQGVHVIETPDLLWGRGRTGWDPWDVLYRVVTISRIADWDVVHSWDCRPVAILPALFARARSRGHGARLWTDWADWWGRGGTQQERGGAWMRVMWPLETFFEEHFRTRADATTTISTPLRERVIELGVPPTRAHLLPQGCGPVAVGDRRAARARLGVPADVPLIIHVGRLLRSDAALLFQAVTALLARRATSRFVMIGQHGAAIPPALATNPRFLATGHVPAAQLDDFVAACDLSVVALADTLAGRARWPSKINGLLAAGRATVVTDVGDLPAILRETGAALVAAPRAEDVVDCIERLLDDPVRRESIETAAAALAAGRLSWRQIVADLEGLYQSL
jgi:glycosyltransferase involved in cell wall biosynthesis